MISSCESNSVAARVQQIRHAIAQTCLACGRDPSQVHLMAVTKTVDTQRVNQAIEAGIRLLGENRAQELSEKYPYYHMDGVKIHFIGHLQTNKVRQIIDKVTMIESLDSIPLAQQIQRQCERIDKQIDCLVQVNIGAEQSKFGVNPRDLECFLRQTAKFDRICVRGLMAIPPVCEKKSDCSAYFSQMHKLFVDIGAKKMDNIHMDFLSMGMSGDYLLAVEHGSNIVRIGSALFGSRVYL